MHPGETARFFMSIPRGNETVPAEEAKGLILKGRARSGMCVEGVLSFPADVRNLRLPPHLDVEVLDLTGCPGAADALPEGLRCFELNLSQTTVRSLPDDLQVDSILNLSGCEELVELPKHLKVGTLLLRGCSALEALPDGLDVWFLDMTGCWSFCRWPRRAAIRSGRLTLRGCTALRSLPDYLGTLAALNVRDCPNLREFPNHLRITGWVDIAQSGLADSKKLPKTLQGVDLRWQGVRVEERILLRPETISVEEILGEQNAERRRVLLDRFGVPRFMQESKASVLDEDRDRGGPRKLLCVEMKEDEPLVTLSCFCPSTSRQYFLRVPPDTKSCRQAAAWIAGFDDPDRYQPILET
jgi:hypothetical protein